MWTSVCDGRLRRGNVITAGVATLCLAIGGVAAQASTITLTNPDDAWLRGGGAVDDSNFGAENRMRAQPGQPGPEETSLVRFNNIASQVPQGETVTSATLSLETYAEAESGNSPSDVEVHRVLQSWDVGSSDGSSTTGVSYNWRDELNGNAWATGGATGATDSVATATDTTSVTDTHQRYEWDVTSDVQQYLAGTADNNGWLIEDSAKDLGPFFETTTFGDGSGAGELVLETAAIPEPASAAFMVVGGGLMLVRRRRKA